jgi:leader peptidase (prepilin peptidase)/N-methyltransferase
LRGADPVVGKTQPVSTPASDETEPEGHDLNLELPQWTMVPLIVALGFVMVWAFGSSLTLVSLLPFAALLGAITIIDLRELRVPNRLVGPGALLAVPLLIVASTADWPDLSLGRALLGALIMGAGYFTLALISPAGMGLGDVKLSPIIGAQLALFGWQPWFRGLLGAFLFVGPVALLLLLLRKAGARTGLPFAPFMVAGAVAALLLEGFG